MGYSIGAVQFADGELYRPQVIELTRVEGMKAQEIAYVQLNNTAIADFSSGQVATFEGAIIATPPAGFAAVAISDFEVYVNGRRVPSQQIVSIEQVGIDLTSYAIEVTIDTDNFFEGTDVDLISTDEVVLVGKFNT